MTPDRRAPKILISVLVVLSLSTVNACEHGGNAGRIDDELTVSETLSHAVAGDGSYISWKEHLIDGEDINGGVPIRGGDGISVVDLDQDGYLDIVTAQEDSNHIRIAYGSPHPNQWELVTLAEGAIVGAVEDVATGDINGDGSPDIVAACEEGHLIYFENPATAVRQTKWAYVIPEVTRNRGSWLRVFIADIDGDGRLDLTAANKGSADLVRLEDGDPDNGSTSFFTFSGSPLESASWREQVLYQSGVPNTAYPLDVDGDGDLDVLAAKRVRRKLILIENLGTRHNGEISHRSIPIAITPDFSSPRDWQGLADAAHVETADLNGDGRLDIVLNVLERSDSYARFVAGLGWLEQPSELSQPWLFHRIGNTLPDWVVGIHLADIDGDGDLDAVTGGYSGVNVLAGTYSGASRDFDEPGVDSASSVARLAWFENPGEPKQKWQRHDISRRVRGLYDMFESVDLDGDGDLDLVAPRGNSGEFDGVFWLEQVRSHEKRQSFTPARLLESKHLSLPPENWQDLYTSDITYIAPNKQ